MEFSPKNYTNNLQNGHFCAGAPARGRAPALPYIDMENVSWYPGRMQNKPTVIIPSNMRPLPEQHEVSAAWILARHFNTTIVFITPSNGYGIKSYDFTMNGLEWELKSPVGTSKKTTIERQFRHAKGKKEHLIIDCRRTELKDDFCEKKVRTERIQHKDVKKLLVITKSK